jgi:PAS domain S-box-containing protein
VATVMSSIPWPSGYELVPLREGADFTLYRGREHGNPSSVLAIAPSAEQPLPETLRRLEHECSLAAKLDPAWAAKPLALAHHEGRTILLLNDPGGEPLDGILEQDSGQPLELTRFLRIAIGLAVSLGQVHRHGLIHKDIKPANVLVDDTGNVWLTGFGIASQLPRERQSPAPPEFIAGTLPYMAPEQTGRMNRSIDSRSDLYALGVTLYEMLTGSLPFTASDPMEWVHCHIARQPVPPGERRRDVSGSVSAIIMKLLAKTAEERYQTAAGAESDLRRCLGTWETQGCIEEFQLGEHDTPDQLMIPERLYGRAREIDTLLVSFERVVTTSRPELVLVSGYSGIGKSSVVNELHKPLVPPRGLFAAGKFDQYKRDIPYATLAQAFQSLIRPLLGKSEAELSKWRDDLRQALDPNGALMVDLVPHLRFILGEQPQIPDLPPQEAKARFQLVFRRFIGVFARPEHPLALFLDDLQWLDAATLDLLEYLLTQSDVQHLMLIGAYRNNEVGPTHPLTRKLDAIRQTGAPVQEIILAPLTPEDLRWLIADSLHCEPERAVLLGQLIHEKTGGNPFFAIQFISALAEEGLLAFDHSEARWSWDLNRIHAKGYTDNVVDLMVERLNRLPMETQKAVQEFACLGNMADVSTLSIVRRTSEEEVHKDLWQGLRLELIARLEDSYKFVHDRVQEAAYSLIPQEMRPAAHLRIGRLLTARTPQEKREEAIFEIVNQFNRGSALITSRDEREQLAELNLIAGKRAKASTAYGSALKYLIAGAALLADDCWEHRRELTFALELHRAECEFLMGEQVVAAQRLTVLTSRAANTVEQAAVACLLVDVYTALDRPDRAIEVCLDYLRHLGVEWSPHPSADEARSEYEQIWSQLGSRAIEELIELPLMSDPASLATLDVLTKAVAPALFTNANLLSLIICRMANLSLKQGNSDGSCFGYVWLGMIAGALFGNYKDGFRFGSLGYELVEHRRLKRFQARTYLCFGQFVMPWTKHVRTCCDLLRRAFEAAERSGDRTFAAYSRNTLNTILLATGDPLAEVQGEAENSLEFAQNARFGIVIDVITAQLGLIRTLRGLTPKFGSFDDKGFDELLFERHLASDPRLAISECWYWIRKLQARFLSGDYPSAVNASLNAERLLWTSPSFFERAEYHFYAALSHAVSCNSASLDRQSFEALAAHHRQLEVWAENCPENFETRTALVAAEIARIDGRELDAEQLYEQAIRSAHANGFVHNEALANELAGRFYLARGFEKIAHAYFRDARYGYLRWGATGKVWQLDGLYPHLKEAKPVAGPISTIEAPVEHLDLATVVKVSQAVSGEIILEKLIDVLMRTAIEHAGAERGLLILPRGEEQRVEAEATISGDTVIVRRRESAISTLPESVIHFVTRTGESVILDDASTQSPFSADTYICRYHARSILCLPLINQAKLIGVLYLENNLTPRAFTPKRITVLKLLASQAAISLENTRLYADLEKSESYLTQAQTLSRTGSFGWNVSTGEIFWSDETYRIMGHARGMKPTLDLAFDRIHPDDREQVRELLGRAAQDGRKLDFEHRLLMPDGSTKNIHVVAQAARNDSNHVEYIGAATDITDRKRAENELQKAFDEIKKLKDQLFEENIALRQEIDQASLFEEIVGSSKALRNTLAQVAKVAPTDSTVLITGETGTGKELVARAIHKRSHRSARAFVAVNCAAVPRDLIASELFGHEKGAFTGATQQRLGRFELAGGGTLFLDEVGELTTETQIALLRVLQEHEFERVGGTKSIQTDVRVIAATNRDLQAAIAGGTFRRDLYFRLNVFPIYVPSLLERQEDIPLLVEYFIHRYARKAGKSIRGMNAKSLELLQAYAWPGNIRELQNVIERSVIVCDTGTFSIDESWLSWQPLANEPKSCTELTRKLASQEKELIEAALRESGGRVSGPSGAAAKLGIPGSTLDSKIRSLKINKNRFKATGHSTDRM